jgi:uncharacterized membrane protein HdeD (DUF308 family)
MEQAAAASQSGWIRIADGVIAILFGLAILFWPGITIGVLILLWGIYALVFGIVHLVRMFGAMGARHRWWVHLILGILSLGAGLFVFVYPGMTAVLLLFVIAAWAVGIGIMEIIASLSGGGFLMAITGVISILFAFVLLANPVSGALALIIVIGLFSIVRGIITLVGALRLPEGMPTEEG